VDLKGTDLSSDVRGEAKWKAKLQE
jgi:hypothetical protein